MNLDTNTIKIGFFYFKSQTVFIFSLIMLSCINVNAQNLHYLFVRPFDMTKDVPNSQELYTNNEALNQVLKKYKTIQYSRFYEGAINPDLNETYEIHASGDIDSLMSELNASGLFKKIEKARYYEANVCMGPPPPISDPFVHLGSPFGIWQLDMIDARCAWEITEGDSNIIVAVADTEFEITHEDLQGKIAYVYDPTPGHYTESGCYHGTPVSGVIAARVNNGKGIAGVGNKTSVAGYRVKGEVSSFGCLGAPFPLIKKAADDGCKVINISWGGGPGTLTEKAAYKEIVDGGTTLVFSGGKLASDISHATYATVPGIINVSSVNSNSPYFAKVDFSC